MRSIRVRAAVMVLLATVLTVALAVSHIARADDQARDFRLDVSPSPLVATLKPGTDTMLQLKIRNSGTTTENLKIEPRKFTIDEKTGAVALYDREEADFAQWVSFDHPEFTVEPGQWYTQKIYVHLPADAGFSYYMALVIQRASETTTIKSGHLIEGSVAVFTLLNVDRPGATRRLEVTGFKATQGIYEYLPAELSMTFRNTGNTIVQPYGNIFIQRSGSKGTIATLPVNIKKGYILPGSDRILTADWSDGFPVDTMTIADDGTKQVSENWDWSQLSHFRIGPYTAKLVAVYNDGRRDVAIERAVTLWVLPWKIILGILAVILFVGLGVWTLLRKTWLLLRRGKKKPQPEQTQPPEEPQA